MSKARYEYENFDDTDVATLLKLNDLMLEDCARKGKSSRYMRHFYFLTHVREWLYTRVRSGLDSLEWRSMFWRYPEQLKKYLYTAYSYFGRKGSEYREKHPRIVYQEFFSRPKPAAFIGVGYRDKGSSRKLKLTVDGSPDWKEIIEDESYRTKNCRSIESYFDDPPDLGIRDDGSTVIL
jgi:hypothetical protein